MSNLSRVRVAGSLEPYAGGFATELSRLGYTPGSAAHQLQLMAHLSRWLAEEGLDPEALTPQAIAAFVDVRRAADYRVYRSSGGLAPLLDHLRSVGALGTAPVRAEAFPFESGGESTTASTPEA